MAAIIIDNGSSMVRAGFAGDNKPKVILPTILGRPRLSGVLASFSGIKEVYVGETAWAKRGIMRIRHPVKEGIIVNWDDMEAIWRHIFIEHDQLRVSPEEHPIVVTESISNPVQNREKLAQVMFERFTVPALAIRTTAELALFASGRKTGLVVEFGYDVTHVVPINEGTVIRGAVQRLDFGGASLTEYLLQVLMEERAYCFSTNQERKEIEKLKERLAYVALDFVEEMKKAESAGPSGEQEFQIHIGNDTESYKVGSELFRVPEAIFNPSLIKSESQGLQHEIARAVSKCDDDIRSQMWANIVLAGGTAMLPGLAERLSNELSSFIPMSTALKIANVDDRSTSAWLGVSLLADILPQNAWWTLKDYERVGPAIVHGRMEAVETP